MLRISVFVLCTLALIGCGFHPRGPMALAPSMHTLYFKSADPYGLLARNIKQYLKVSGVALVHAEKDANLTLELNKEELVQQLLSVGGTQQTRQYNLILNASFQVLDAKGQILLPAQTVSESRTLPIQSNQILAGSTEANNLYNQMRLALAYDIMIRLSAQDTINILMGHPSEVITPTTEPEYR